MSAGALWIIAALLLATVVWGAWTFNRLVALGARASGAWSDIDVQLRKRWDLVRRLVDTVAGYAAHERTTLEDVASARATATQAAGPARQAHAESDLNRGVARLFALAEAYPDLKADALFRSLHDQLIDVEDDLESARRYYNAVVRDLNTMIEQFPSLIVAGATRRTKREFFELTDLREAGAPMVRFQEAGR
jgi:LemA protein